MILYKGFSTLTGKNQFSLTDFKLVTQDLMNNFNIRKGEKLMNPDYGTIIWDLLFSPFDAATKQAIVDDVKRIVSLDPRIGARNVKITEYDQGIQIELDLVFVQTNQINTLRISFDRNSQISTQK